jgi:acetyl esterase/lipase
VLRVQRRPGSFKALKPRFATQTLDVVYSGSLKLDIFDSPNANSPMILHIHGGGWTSNTSTGLGQTKDTIANKNIVYALVQHGFTVFDMNYTLVSSLTGNTDTTIRDTMLTNIYTAAAYARTNAVAHNGRADRLAFMGESAGGHLAILAAALEATKPEAVLAWSSFTRLDQYGNDATIKNYLGISTDPSGAGAATAQAYSGYNQAGGLTMPIRVVTFSTDLAGVRVADTTDLITLLNRPTAIAVTVSGSSHADFTGYQELEDSMTWTKGVLA